MKPRTSPLPTLGLLAAAALFAACSSGGGGSIVNGFAGGDGGGAGKGGDASTRGSGDSPEEGSDDDDGVDEPSTADAGRKRDAGATRDSGTSKDASSSGFDAASFDAGPPKETETCSFISTCTGGSSLKFCATTTSLGTCTSARYDLGGTSYQCASCTNCTSADADAQLDCRPSSGFDAGTTNPTPLETCSAVGTTCKTGTLQYCYTSTQAGCTSRYVHAGTSYACPSCSSCDAGWGPAYVSCMDAEYGCDDLQYCCGSFPSQSQSSCYSAVSTYRAQAGGDVSCKQTYDSYRNAGYCP